MSTHEQQHGGQEHEHGREQGGHEHGRDDCVDYIERIVYLIDNELDQADCAVVELHLRECGPCLERYDLQRTVKSIVARSCTEAAPADLRQRVMFQIREVQVRITEG